MKKILLSLLSLTFACSIGIFTSKVSVSASTTNSLTFATNGGTEYEVVTTNGNQGVSLPTPQKYGCEFLGWYDNASFNGEALTEYYIPSGNDTIYAKWSTPNYPIVTFNSNGGTKYANLTYKGNSILLPTPTKLDYTFKGWYTSSSFSGSALGQTYDPTASITLYAKWEAVAYPVVTFVSNGGTEYNNTTSNSAGIKLPTPTREGYTFDGWYTNSNLSSGKITTAVYKPTSSCTIYAKWTAKTKYTISLNTNGGLNLSAITDYQGTQVTLPTPSRYGYKFLGWYNNVTLSGSPVTKVTLSANATYYAKWSQVYYVYLYYNESNTYDRLEYAAGSTLKIADLPTPAEYKKRNVVCPFVRWTNEDGTTATDTTVNSNIVLVAKYDTTKAIAKNLVDNGNGTYTSKTLGSSGKAIWIFQDTATNIGTYSVDVQFKKGSNGGTGIAFRMTHSGRDYAFEDNGTSYIAAVIGPNSGAMDVSKVINGGWSLIGSTIALTSLPSAWQTKFNNAAAGSIINVNIKVVSYSDGFIIYIDNQVAYTHTDTTILAPFTGTGWGIRNTTTNNAVTFSNVTSYSESVNNFNHLTNNGNGTYTTTSTKTVAIFHKPTTQTVTYSATFNIVKGNGGGVGLAFRMKSTAMYAYENAGTQYISAVYCPDNGALQVSMVDGDKMVYENSNPGVFFQLRGTNCKGTSELSPVNLADLPSSWQTKYNNAAAGATITSTMKIIDYGTKFEVYIDNALAFTVTDAILSHFTGTGLGMRTSSTGATISNIAYTQNQASQVNADAQIALIPSKEENL